jgi:ribose/xylose/arabinose/galactoside ABC-type transport system permease subunit
VVGVLFIALIDNGYALLQYDQLWEPITLGLLLLAAVALDAVQRGLVRPGAAVRKLAARVRA